MPMKARKLLKDLYGKYLLYTNIASCCIFKGSGEIISQEIQYRHGVSSERFHKDRINGMFVLGLIQGAINHYFYGRLDHLMPLRNLRTTIVKILCDQIILTPIYLAMFFYMTGYMEGSRFAEITTEFQKRFLQFYLADWSFWAVVQSINFLFLPSRYRVLYINVASLNYNIMLSYLKQNT